MKEKRIEKFCEGFMVVNGMIALLCVVSFFAWAYSDLKIFGTFSFVFLVVAVIMGTIRGLFEGIVESIDEGGNVWFEEGEE